MRICYRDPETGEECEPLRWQALFHREWRTWGRIAGGAFGAGKSLALMQDWFRMMARFPGIRAFVCRKVLKDLRGSTQKVLFENVMGCNAQNASEHPAVEYWNQADQFIRFKDGSELWFVGAADSGARKAGGARSKEFGYGYFDEITEISREAFLEWVGRLRQPGMPCGWAAATNPEPNWCKTDFHPSSKERQANVAFFQTRTSANFHLPKDYETRLRELYPETWVKRFLDGSWDVFEGQIFVEFDARRHVRMFDVPQPGLWREFCALDWGYTNPTAILFVGVDYDDHVWIYGEHYQQGWRAGQHAEAVGASIKARSIRMILADPSCWNVNSSGLYVSDEFQRSGITLTKANNEVIGGIHFLKTLLSQDRITIHPSCENLLRELPAYQWKDLTPGREDYMNSPEEPVKKNDHAVDALRYACNYILAGGLPKPEVARPSDLLKRRMESLLKQTQGGSRRGTAW